MRWELLDEKIDQRGVESPCLGGFAGDFGALFGVEGPSRSRRFSLISWRRCVTKTDSATLLAAMNPVYFPWLRVRAVNSEVLW